MWPPPQPNPPNAPPPSPAQTAFQYSNDTGRRKALLIGINYLGQRGQLRNCINDMKNMLAFLQQDFGYKRDNIVILTEDQQYPMSQPTKENILRAMHWLVKDARPNDSLYFHYSGEKLMLRNSSSTNLGQAMEVNLRTLIMMKRMDMKRLSTQ